MRTPSLPRVLYRFCTIFRGTKWYKCGKKWYKPLQTPSLDPG
nr:MAG TPA: hypothetical protein [Caudoviricetes sp.]